MASWSGSVVAHECRAAVEATARGPRRRRHDVADDRPAIDPDQLRRILVTSWAVALAHRAATLEQALGRPPPADTVEAVTMAMIERGNATSAVELLDSYGGCNAVSRSIGSFFETVDVLMLPSTARPPWPLGVQIVGRFADEATLLRLASQLGGFFPWADHIPPVAAGRPAR
jgi:amidase